MYLTRRNGVYYFRRRIPASIRNLLTAEERSAFHHSLETKDRHEALKHYAGRHERTTAIIERVLRRVPDGAPCDDEQDFTPRRKALKRSRTFYQFNEPTITALCNAWLARALEGMREYALDIHTHWDAESRTECVNELLEELDFLQNKQDSEVTDQFVYQEVEDALEQADCEPPIEWTKHDLFRKFYNRIHQGMILVRTIGIEIIRKGIERNHLAVISASRAVVDQPIFSKGGKTLDEVFGLFAAAPKRAEVRENTKKEYEPIFTMLRQEQPGRGRCIHPIYRQSGRF